MWQKEKGCLTEGRRPSLRVCVAESVRMHVHAVCTLVKKLGACNGADTLDVR